MRAGARRRTNLLGPLLRAWRKTRVVACAKSPSLYARPNGPRFFPVLSARAADTRRPWVAAFLGAAWPVIPSLPRDAHRRSSRSAPIPASCEHRVLASWRVAFERVPVLLWQSARGEAIAIRGRDRKTVGTWASRLENAMSLFHARTVWPQFAAGPDGAPGACSAGPGASRPVDIRGASRTRRGL